MYIVMPSFFGSVSPASEDRGAECGNGASVLADGDNGLRGQGGSSSEVIDGVLKEDEDAGPKKRRTEMELEVDFVRDHMNQYEQVSCFYFLIG